jgi:hypothetical protein
MPASSCNISCAGGRAKGSTSLRLYRNVTPAASAGWSKRTAHGARKPRVEFNVLDFDQLKLAVRDWPPTSSCTTVVATSTDRLGLTR